jgi:uncharacterized membrane protein YcaP (DUF421 family)
MGEPTVNWMGYKLPEFQRFINPPPLLLVKNGQIIHRHLERELITEDELMSKFRQQSIEFLDDVKLAFMEADGSISVITYDSKTRSIAKQQAKSNSDLP